MKSDWDRLEKLFLAALELEPTERTAWLVEACPGDEELRAELEAMLDAHEGEELQVETRLLGAHEDPSLVGQRLGPYRLLSVIGRGGMGEVYLAERDDELYDRQVAIKLVQYGPRASLHERFARERAILARLTHPNVATLYDGGLAEDGRPYLVMEYVDGLPITEYCDAGALDLRARIELFLTVCEAVQFAHGALVIHRDLKPSNILVDAQGRPKLLDFGIAKLLEGGEEDSVHTTALDRVLTPEHAAPEQIRGEDPTTATDVYGLGVLLCELLVGAKPLLFPTRSPVEIDRIAREVDALPPSSLLGQMEPEAAAACAQQRTTTRESLARQLRGDLDAICNKALRKQSEERYPSVAEIMADLRRHLNSRPVRAMQGTRSYNARKFLRRHRSSLALSALAFVVLSGFLILSLQQAREVREQRDRAEREVERADLVLNRLVGLFESTQPEVLGGPDMLDVGEFLERGEETAEMLGDETETKRRMYATLAEIYALRGDLDRAIELTARSRDLAQDPLEKLGLAHEYALLRNRRDGQDVGVPLLRASLEDHRTLLGPTHPDVAQAMRALSTSLDDPLEMRTLLEEALEIEAANPQLSDARRAAGLNALATLEIGESRYAEAQALLEDAVRLLDDGDPTTEAQAMVVRHNLSAVYARRGNWELAEPLQRAELEQRRDRYGENSDLTANALESHAVTLANLGRHRESGEAFAEALAIFESTLDPLHWRIANSTRNVGQLLALQGRYREALPFLDRSIQINLSRGADAPGLQYVLGQRALIRLGLGEREESARELRAIADYLDDPAAGQGGVYAADGRLWLGIAELQLGNQAAALLAFERALELRRELLGNEHPKTQEALCGVGLAGGNVSGGKLDELEFAAAIRGYRAWGLAHPLLLDPLAEFGY